MLEWTIEETIVEDKGVRIEYIISFPLCPKCERPVINGLYCIHCGTFIKPIPKNSRLIKKPRVRINSKKPPRRRKSRTPPQDIIREISWVLLHAWESSITPMETDKEKNVAI